MFVGILGFFPVAVIKYDNKQLKGERVTLAYGSRLQPIIGGSQGFRNLKHLLTPHPQPRAERNELSVLRHSPGPKPKE